LQFAIIQEGTGARAQPYDRVTVNYTGWVKGGALFDSSLTADRSPFQFVLGEHQVIKAWDEAVALMNVGGVYRIGLRSAV
jgi:FKBP-type peptidyl-prolyl cis-trans isomerases 1